MLQGLLLKVLLQRQYLEFGLNKMSFYVIATPLIAQFQH